MNRLHTRRDLMPKLHQSSCPWLHALGVGEVLSISGIGHQRWLQVQGGSLWVTAAVAAPGPLAREADIWLSAGDSLVLPPGSAWLLQAWPAAQWLLLQQAPQAEGQPAWAGAPGWVQAVAVAVWAAVAGAVVRWAGSAFRPGGRRALAATRSVLD